MSTAAHPRRLPWGRLTGLLGVTAGGYLLQRQAVRWGATDAEAHLPLPGDELIPRPMIQATHAVTIAAPPHAVWQWLVQIGYQRAGWYIDAPWWNRNCERYYQALADEQGQQTAPVPPVTNADRIVPAWQNLNVGDHILDGPPGTVFFVVRAVEPDRVLVCSSDTHIRYLAPRAIRNTPRYGIAGELSATYLLEAVGQEATRLILRTRATYRPRWFGVLALPLVLGWGELLTARMQLYGLKERAERATASAA